MKVVASEILPQPILLLSGPSSLLPVQVHLAKHAWQAGVPEEACKKKFTAACPCIAPHAACSHLAGSHPSALAASLLRPL